MKIPKKIPIIAVIILIAIYFANKDEIRDMFNKNADPVVCASCDDGCECHEEDGDCDCINDCVCPLCVE